MNVIVFGASGMVGGGILRECLEDPHVESILSVGRRSCGLVHPKLREQLMADLFALEEVKEDLTGYDACFYSLGVSSVGRSEAEYRKVTLELTIRTARVLDEVNPGLTFCYVSAQGADGSGRGRLMWARVRGETENRLLQMPFPAFIFRPGAIQPLKGVRSRTRAVRALYTFIGPLFPLLNRLFPNQVTTTVRIGQAMIRAARGGCSKHVLEARDINALVSL
jgi:uncharacterized protein YbjT (DUF2867 family)